MPFRASASRRHRRAATDWALGVGGAFNASRRFSIRLQYEKLKNVGDPDQTGEGDVDVVDLGLMIRL